MTDNQRVVRDVSVLTAVVHDCLAWLVACVRLRRRIFLASKEFEHGALQLASAVQGVDWAVRDADHARGHRGPRAGTSREFESQSRVRVTRRVARSWRPGAGSIGPGRGGDQRGGALVCREAWLAFHRVRVSAN